MHRTSARPAPLDFPLPPYSTYDIDRRKDLRHSYTLPNLTPAYFEAPIRDGLRTPPADDMGTTYQQSQYNNYAGRQDVTYPTPATSGSGYAGSYSGANVQQRPYPPPLSHPPSASNLRNEIEPSQPAQPLYPQPASPQQTKKINTLAPPEGLPRRKSTNNDMILPNLQIPSSINNSGGSLAEFAAQVSYQDAYSLVIMLIMQRLHVCSGSNQQIHYIKQSNCPPLRLQ